MAKLLVIGGGGREHALVWKLAQSKDVEKIYVAPGNGGTASVAENVQIPATDIPAIVNFAKEKEVDLTVVVPDDPLAAGAVDALQQAGLTAFGPAQAAAQIEASKAFSKQLMADQNIPTATFRTFTDFDKALVYAKSQKFPLVVKASGLALGKGVVICQNLAEAEAALRASLLDKTFGEAGATVVIEEFLQGQEVSVHVLTDGQHSALFPASQDHKQIHDGDQGPNTGGMGAFAPVTWVDQNMMNQVEKTVVQPALAGLTRQNATFSGLLYPGLMIGSGGLKVLEFNARFGDPETQVYMRLLDSDLYELLLACAKGQLDSSKLKWQTGYAVCVVLASGGYPGKYQKGLPISGLGEAQKVDGVVVFHAGTAKTDTGYATAGGRVLNVTAIGKTLDQALERAYKAVDSIKFEGMQYRHDIGRRPKPDWL